MKCSFKEESTVKTVYKYYSIIISVGLLAGSGIGFYDFETPYNFSEVILCTYVIIFAVLNIVSYIFKRVMQKYFGFLYTFLGRAIFYALLGTLALPIMPRNSTELWIWTAFVFACLTILNAILHLIALCYYRRNISLAYVDLEEDKKRRKESVDEKREDHVSEHNEPEGFPVKSVPSIHASNGDSNVTFDCRAFFSPGDEPLNTINSLIKSVKKTLDICVFTITDDRVFKEIVAAFSRGVKIRVISDDEQTKALGSDVGKLAKAGIPTRTDNSPAHMHHKFAIFDNSYAVTGSFNWTRAASNENRENIIVTNHSGLIVQFQKEFDKLWNEFVKNDLK